MAKKETLPTKGEERARPVSSFSSLRDEIDRVLDDFMSFKAMRPSLFEADPFDRWSWARFGERHHADIIEKDGAYEIDIDVPGFTQDDIDISLSNGTITISGESHDEREEKKENYYLSERHHGSFKRSFRLPEGIDADKIEAKLDKGVLAVVLPMSEKVKQAEKHIAIKADK